jgi:hypothetical protein
VTVGGGGRVLSTMGSVAPRLTDKVMEGAFFAGQKKDEPNDRGQDSLHAPSGTDMEERGEYDGHVSESSAYTAVRLHPLLASVAAIGAGAAIAALVLTVTGRPRGAGLGLGRRVPRAVDGFSRGYRRASKPVAQGVRRAARNVGGVRAAFEEWVSGRPFTR